MAKRQRSVSLAFILFRFAVVMLGCMLLCCIVWLITLGLLEKNGIIYKGYVANQQVEQLLSENPETFVSPKDTFLSDYALYDSNGRLLETNAEGEKLKELTGLLHKDVSDVHIVRHSYSDGSTVIIRWNYRSEFVNPALRSKLPPFEYLWWCVLVTAWALCLLFHTLRLGRQLANKLKLFGEVSEKVGSQKLDFTVPHAGIREYDQALDAMEQMRKTLYNSLSSQWAAQQEREAEIAALAHDLRTPITLIGGNAELLLDEELTENNRRMVETIIASNNRAKQYVAGLLDTFSGIDEAFENVTLAAMFEELCQSTLPVAQAHNVCLKTENNLEGTFSIQKDHLLRAFGNVIQNSIEHTPKGGNVYLTASMADGGWQIIVQDEGAGFSKAALEHATERLWRGDAARVSDGHNGLGLWFAAQVVKNHSGKLELGNCEKGGIVTIRFPSIC